MSKSRDIADSAATINYIDGLTSDAQTQLNAKVENLTDLGVTATSTELNYVDGVTSAIQTQIDGKEPADATILKDADIGSSVLGYVAPSTSGNVLTSDGTNWTSSAPAGGGAWEFISTTTASSASTVDVTWTGSYDAVMLVIKELLPNSASGFEMRWKIGSSWANTGYGYWTQLMNASTSTPSSYVATSSTAVQMQQYGTSETANGHTGIITLFRPSSTTQYKTATYELVGLSSNSTYSTYVARGGAKNNSSTSAVTGVRLYYTTKTFDATIHLYGLKTS